MLLLLRYWPVWTLHRWVCWEALSSQQDDVITGCDMALFSESHLISRLCYMCGRHGSPVGQVLNHSCVLPEVWRDSRTTRRDDYETLQGNTRIMLNSLGPVYTKRQRQRCDNSAMTLVILFSLKTVELFNNGLQPHSGVTPLCSMRMLLLVSSQSCCSIDAWCKRTLTWIKHNLFNNDILDLKAQQGDQMALCRAVVSVNEKTVWCRLSCHSAQIS